MTDKYSFADAMMARGGPPSSLTFRLADEF